MAAEGEGFGLVEAEREMGWSVRAELSGLVGPDLVEVRQVQPEGAGSGQEGIDWVGECIQGKEYSIEEDYL